MCDKGLSYLNIAKIPLIISNDHKLEKITINTHTYNYINQKVKSLRDFRA